MDCTKLLQHFRWHLVIYSFVFILFLLANNQFNISNCWIFTKYFSNWWWHIFQFCLRVLFSWSTLRTSLQICTQFNYKKTIRNKYSVKLIHVNDFLKGELKNTRLTTSSWTNNSDDETRQEHLVKCTNTSAKIINSVSSPKKLWYPISYNLKVATSHAISTSTPRHRTRLSNLNLNHVAAVE